MQSSSLQGQILYQLLKGVVKFALRSSIRLKEIVEILKQVLVDSAIDELKASASSVNSARLSVMTGVHRKDVDRLINQDTPALPSQASLISKVIGQWRGNPAFSNKIGHPKILAYDKIKNSFADLVRSISSELNPSLVLAELERVGAVKKNNLGIKLVAQVYVPNEDTLNYYQMLAEDTGDLVSCIDQNITKTAANKNLHIKTEYDSIPDNLVGEVSEWLLKFGATMHDKIAKYLSTKDKDLNPSLRKQSGRNRVALVSFSISSPSIQSEDNIKKE